MFKRLNLSLRKGAQHLLAKMGKVELTLDSRYDELKSSYDEERKRVVETQKKLQAVLRNVTELSQLIGRMTEKWISLFADLATSEAPHTDLFDSFRDSVTHVPTPQPVQQASTTTGTTTAKTSDSDSSASEESSPFAAPIASVVAPQPASYTLTYSLTLFSSQVYYGCVVPLIAYMRRLESIRDVLDSRTALRIRFDNARAALKRLTNPRRRKPASREQIAQQEEKHEVSERDYIAASAESKKAIVAVLREKAGVYLHINRAFFQAGQQMWQLVGHGAVQVGSSLQGVSAALEGQFEPVSARLEEGVGEGEEGEGGAAANADSVSWAPLERIEEEKVVDGGFVVQLPPPPVSLSNGRGKLTIVPPPPAASYSGHQPGAWRSPPNDDGKKPVRKVVLFEKEGEEGEEEPGEGGLTSSASSKSDHGDGGDEDDLVETIDRLLDVNHDQEDDGELRVVLL